MKYIASSQFHHFYRNPQCNKYSVLKSSFYHDTFKKIIFTCIMLYRYAAIRFNEYFKWKEECLKIKL